LSSGCDSSTGDSKGSKLSNEVSINAWMAFYVFNSFTLPFVVRSKVREGLRRNLLWSN
jgi:hypothetical protein